MDTIFLLSPARCDGRRAKILLNPTATFELAVRLRAAGTSIGETFAFMSGLYFRGKLTYATRFGRRTNDAASAYVITTDRGLLTADTVITRDDLVAFGCVDIAKSGEEYLAPLRRDIARLAADLAPETRIVLLGSIATGKYVDALIATFGERLLFPSDFVGRGDMSRGGLLLRSAADGAELGYAPVLGAVRHGKRPPKLPPLRRR
jgi:hypothetical protein